MRPSQTRWGIPMPSEWWVNTLVERITARAAASGWSRKEFGSELAVLEPGAQSNLDAPATDGALPVSRRMLLVEPAPYVILLIRKRRRPTTSPSSKQSWRAALRSSATAACHLVPKRRSGGWQRLSRAIATNEHFCRKFVWLAPESTADGPSSAESMLDRTFFARPWSFAPATGARVLNPLVGVLNDPALDGLASRSQLSRWLEVLSRFDRGGREVAQDLLEVTLVE